MAKDLQTCMGLLFKRGNLASQALGQCDEVSCSERASRHTPNPRHTLLKRELKFHTSGLGAKDPERVLIMFLRRLACSRVVAKKTDSHPIEGGLAMACGSLGVG